MKFDLVYAELNFISLAELMVMCSGNGVGRVQRQAGRRCYFCNCYLFDWSFVLLPVLV